MQNERFKGIALLTAIIARNRMSLTLVVTVMQCGSCTFHGFKLILIVV